MHPCITIIKEEVMSLRGYAGEVAVWRKRVEMM